MQIIEKTLENIFLQTITKIYPNLNSAEKLFIQKTHNQKFGDFQTNFPMSVAKIIQENPRTIGQTIIDNLETNHLIAKCELAGPGFINIFLKNQFLSDHIKQIDIQPWDFSFLPRAGQIIIDYSSPNIAKPMHVGHLRSTILGDTLKRIYRYLGYEVVGDNHIGDWGTQFGKLIVAYHKWLDKDNYKKHHITELERIYIKFANEAKKNPELDDQARAELKKLQDGDPENTRLWKEFVKVSLDEYEKTYQELDISFDTVQGESFYHNSMPDMVKLLLDKKIAQIDQEAVVVFFPESENLHPCVIQKKDGAFLYATSDIACLNFRKNNYKVNKILYIVDERQQPHFKQVFSIIKKLGWNLDSEHIPFGFISFSGAILSTRAGNVIKLEDLIAEAIKRVKKVINTKNPQLSTEEKNQIAHVVGIGAIKYADLSQNRTSSYDFDWDRMLAFDGNTGPYLQYTYARIQSLIRKSKTRTDFEPTANIILDTDTEKNLCLNLTLFPQVLIKTMEAHKPNTLTEYLFELAQKFNTLYNSMPIIKETSPIFSSRLIICQKTAFILKTGLNLLGINVVDRM